MSLFGGMTDVTKGLKSGIQLEAQFNSLLVRAVRHVGEHPDMLADVQAISVQWLKEAGAEVSTGIVPDGLIGTIVTAALGISHDPFQQSRLMLRNALTKWAAVK